MTDIDYVKLRQKVRKELSFTGSNILKKLNNSLNQNNSKDNSNSKASLKKKKYVLSVKKINIKDRENNYYSQALKNMFFNPDIYLNNDYKGKKVIIGKKYEKVKGIRQLYEYFLKINKRRKTVANKNELRSLTLFQKILQKSKSLKSLKSLKSFKSQDLSGKNSSVSETSKTLMFSPSKNEVKDVPVSDNDLKLIYKEIVEREEKNMKNKVKYYNPKDYLNKTQGLGINLMLNLQEKILQIKNKRNKMNQELSNKIMNITSKDKNRILMNDQKDVLIIKGKTLDKELAKFNFANQNIDGMMKNWLFNLRKNNQEEQKAKMRTPAEIIYSNKNIDFFPNKSDIDIRKQLFKKLSINSSINTHKEEKDKKNIINMKRSRKNYRNNDYLNNSMSLNSFHNLFIQGKNLLNQEIKLSKELFGKKKKLFQYSFVPNEVSSILVAKSNSIENVTTPKAIINSMEIHKLE